MSMQTLERIVLAATVAAVSVLALCDREVENADEGNEADMIGPQLDAVFLDAVLGR